MKRILSFVILTFIFVSASACSKKDGNTVSDSDMSNEDKINYTLIISCEEILQNKDNDNYAIKKEKKGIVPDNGIIYEADLSCNDGDNVYDTTVKALKKSRTHFDGNDGYFSGIGNIYAGDCGEFSGWMLFVNGKLADLGAKDTKIAENDVIEFKYVVNYNTLFD